MKNPGENIIWLDKGQKYNDKVQSLIKSVKESCVDLKNLGNAVYQERHNWAAINLYNLALSRPDKTLDKNL